jgi:hypothetical protein
MMFSSNTSRFVLVLAAAFSAVTSAEGVRGRRSLEATVELLSAGDYTILTKTGISTVPSSVITGDIAVSPIAATAITGFDLTLHSTKQYSESTQVSEMVYAASYGGATATTLTTAVSAMETAYADAAGRSTNEAARKNLGAGTLGAGGLFGGPNAPLTPGVYTFDTNVLISGNIFFEGSGVFIIQIAGSLTQAADVRVTLRNGASAQNIFWQVAGDVKVGAGAHLEGILLAKTAVTFETGSSLNGRILAQTHCALQVATIAQP